MPGAAPLDVAHSGCCIGCWSSARKPTALGPFEEATCDTPAVDSLVVRVARVGATRCATS